MCGVLSQLQHTPLLCVRVGTNFTCFSYQGDMKNKHVRTFRKQLQVQLAIFTAYCETKFSENCHAILPVHE
jgi:hypothetical protein